MFYEFTIHLTTEINNEIFGTEESFRSSSFLDARTNALEFIRNIETNYLSKGLKFKRQRKNDNENIYKIAFLLTIWKSEKSQAKITAEYVNLFVQGKFNKYTDKVENEEKIISLLIGGKTTKPKALQLLVEEISIYKKHHIDISKIGTRKVKDLNGKEYEILKDSWLYWERKNK